MIATLTHLDRILRGDTTRPDRLRENGLAELPLLRLVLVLVALAGSYGICMGVYAVTGAGHGDYRQVIASAAKVPALFVLTLFVTMPSLYVFNALLGSRLTFAGLVRLMVAAMAVTMAVLASIGPIVAFFGITTSSYAFVLLLNVAVFAGSGLLGLAFLKQTLGRMASVERRAPDGTTRTAASIEAGGPTESAAPSVIDARPPPLPHSATDDASAARGVFAIWMLVFGLVGAQMAWILRPFIGSPGMSFSWFRDRGSNFFVAVWGAIEQLSR